MMRESWTLSEVVNWELLRRRAARLSVPPDVERVLARNGFKSAFCKARRGGCPAGYTCLFAHNDREAGYFRGFRRCAFDPRCTRRDCHYRHGEQLNPIAEVESRLRVCVEDEVDRAERAEMEVEERRAGNVLEGEGTMTERDREQGLRGRKDFAEREMGRDVRQPREISRLREWDERDRRRPGDGVRDQLEHTDEFWQQGEVVGRDDKNRRRRVEVRDERGSMNNREDPDIGSTRNRLGEFGYGPSEEWRKAKPRPMMRAAMERDDWGAVQPETGRTSRNGILPGHARDAPPTKNDVRNIKRARAPRAIADVGEAPQVHSQDVGLAKRMASANIRGGNPGARYEDVKYRNRVDEEPAVNAPVHGTDRVANADHRRRPARDGTADGVDARARAEQVLSGGVRGHRQEDGSSPSAYDTTLSCVQRGDHVDASLRCEVCRTRPMKGRKVVADHVASKKHKANLQEHLSRVSDCSRDCSAILAASGSSLAQEAVKADDPRFKGVQEVRGMQDGADRKARASSGMAFCSPVTEDDAWLDAPMTMEDWKNLEREALGYGGDCALAFKTVRDIVLSPVGAEEGDLSLYSSALRSTPLSIDQQAGELVVSPEDVALRDGATQDEVDAFARMQDLLRRSIDPFAANKFSTEAEEQRFGMYGRLHGHDGAISIEQKKDGTAFCNIPSGGLRAACLHPKSALLDPLWLSLVPNEVRRAVIESAHACS